MIKMLVAGPDVNVSARANHSRADDVTSFPISWKVFVQSNSGLRYSNSAEDGLAGKIVEIHPPFEFVPKELFDDENPRQRIAKPSLSTRALKGEFAAELFAWARALACTFHVDICGGRILSPQPPDVITLCAEAAPVPVSGAQLSLPEKIVKVCEYKTDPTEALECSKLKAMFPGHDNSEWTSIGFGSTSNFRGQIRRKTEV